MSTTAPVPGDGTDARSHLTVEDAGSTTDAGELARDDTRPRDGAAGARLDGDAAAPPAPERASADDDPADGRSAAPTASGVDRDRDGADGAPSGGLASLIGDDSIGHVFDQTNGVIDGLDGDSDGTADSDLHAAADRADENPAFESFADTEAASSPDTDDTRRTGA